MQDPQTDDLREERLKAHDNVIDNLCHPHKGWCEHGGIEDIRLPKDYLDVRVHILVHFRVGGVPVEFVALFQRTFDVAGIERNEAHFIHDLRGVAAATERSSERFAEAWSDTARYMASTDRDQHAVLVDVVKLVDLPENISPTFVWFESIDRFYRILPYTLYFSRCFGLVFCGAFGNGEVDVPARRDTTIRNKEKLVGQMVQRTPQVVDNTTSNRGNLDRHMIGSSRDVIDQLSCLRISLGADYVWLGTRREEGPHLHLQFTDVLLGPSNFCADQRQPLISFHWKGHNASCHPSILSPFFEGHA